MTYRDIRHKLPEQCAVVLPGHGGAIALVKRGERGYFSTNWTAEDMERYNNANNVTQKQINAMLMGSMFGWDVPGADPDNL